MLAAVNANSGPSKTGISAGCANSEKASIVQLILLIKMLAQKGLEESV